MVVLTCDIPLYMHYTIRSSHVRPILEHLLISSYTIPASLLIISSRIIQQLPNRNQLICWEFQCTSVTYLRATILWTVDVRGWHQRNFKASIKWNLDSKPELKIIIRKSKMISVKILSWAINGHGRKLFSELNSCKTT